MKRARVMLTLLVVAVFALGSVPTAATAAEAVIDPDPQIAEMLDAVPGGILIDSHHAVWPELDMEMTVPRTSEVTARSVGGCATGKICAFNAFFADGSALSFGTCGVHSIPANFTVKSVANARSSGTAQARNGSTVLKTITAGTFQNTSGTVTNIRCTL
ncbi:hypothetical protein [Microbacterium sp. NPDC087591]|uniref:hypothetical protein n=1 Tax=Microbacterium sp. NPDC087591 TaxID=3364192 RepID=UPI0037F1A9A4